MSDPPRKSRQMTIALRRLMLQSVGITLLTVLVRSLGWMQPLELATYDHLMRLRSHVQPETMDDRIVIIEITHEDLIEFGRIDTPAELELLPTCRQREGQGSLPDCVYDALFRKLEHSQPRAIGLDIYRADLSNQAFAVAPDSPYLRKFLTQDDRTVAVCQAAIPELEFAGIEPPPEVPPDRLGFSDFVGGDQEGTIRRHLLQMRVAETSAISNPCQTEYALSVQLALRYLRMQPEWIEGSLQIGQVTISRLSASSAGYHSIDAGGYQTLLNYRAPQGDPRRVALRLRLGSILRNEVPHIDEQLRDRIILIGRTDPASDDWWLTPYARPVPGVILQAQMVSQLLSAVLQDEHHRPLLRYWTMGQASLWIFLWSAIASLVWDRSNTRPSRSLMRWVIVCGFLYLSCAIALIQFSIWIPLIPPAAAVLTVTAIGWIKGQHQ